MVELDTTGSREDTRLVRLECTLVGFDGDGDRSHGDGGGHLGVAVGCDVCVSSDDTIVGLLLGFVANSVGHGVWVIGFGIETSVHLDVLESVVHEATRATLVTFGGGAVHELLFRKTVGSSWHGSGGDLDTSFGRASGGE